MKRSYSSFVSLVLSLCLIFQCFILLPVIVNAEGNTTDVTILYEEISLRQENAKHFMCSDGSYLAVSYPDAIHYWDGEEWKDIDNRLFYNESIGRYVNSENPIYQVSLDGAGTVSTVISENETVTWQVSLLTDKKQNKAEKKNGSVKNKNKSSVKNQKVKNAHSLDITTTSSSIIFENAFGKKYPVDLEYIIGQKNIKENVVFNESSDAIGVAWDLSLPEGAYPEVKENGSVYLFHADGTVLSIIGSPYAYDQSGSLCHNINVTLTQTNKDWQIQYILDSEWLGHESRQYPVVLDPILTVNGMVSYDTYYEAVLSNAQDAALLDYLWIESGVVSSGYHYAFVDIAFPAIDTAMYDVTSAILQFTVKDNKYSETAGLYRVPSDYRESCSLGMINNEGYRYATENFVCNPTLSGNVCSYDLLQDDTNGFPNIIGYLSGIDSNGYTIHESVYGKETRLYSKESSNYPPVLYVTYQSKNRNNMCVTLQNADNNNYIQASGSTIGLTETVSTNATEIFKLVRENATDLYKLCPVNNENKCIAVSNSVISLVSTNSADTTALWSIQKNGTKYTFINTASGSPMYLSVENNVLTISSTLNNLSKWTMEDAYSIKADLGDNAEFIIINSHINKSLEYASLWSAGTGEQTVVAGEFDATVDLTVQSGSGYTAVYNDICQRFKIVPVTSTSSASDYYILPYLRLQGEIKGSYREEYRLAVKNNELCIMYCASGNDPNCAQWEFWGDLSSCMLINRANGGHNGLGLSSSSTGVKIGISPSTFKWEIKPICLNVDKIYQETNYTCGAASSVMILNYLRPNASITETDYTTNMLEYFGKDNIYKEIGENYKYYNHYLGSNVYAYASIDNINKYFLTTANSLTLGYPIQVIMQSKSNEKSKLGYTTSGHFLVLKGQYYNPISQVYETVSNDCHYMFGPNDNNANTNNVGGRDLIIDFTTFYTISNYSWARIAYGINADSVT